MKVVDYFRMVRMELFTRREVLYILCYFCIRMLSTATAEHIVEITPVLTNASVAVNRTDVAQTERTPEGTTQYCYLRKSGTFFPYWNDNNGTKSAPRSLDADVLRVGAPKCTNCECGVTGYKILLKGQVPLDQVKNVLQETGNAWKEVYGQGLMKMADIRLDEWTTHFIGQEPDYTFHDPVYGNLTYLTYAVLVANASTKDLMIPDLKQDELLAHAANFTFPPCGDCLPMLDQSIYLSGLPYNDTNVVVAIVLANIWNEWNREVAAVGPLTIQPNYTITAGYNATIGTDAFPVQRLDYTVIMPPGISWATLDYVDVPSLAVFNKHFRAEITPSIIVYPNEFIQRNQDVNSAVGNFTLKN